MLSTFSYCLKMFTKIWNIYLKSKQNSIGLNFPKGRSWISFFSFLIWKLNYSEASSSPRSDFGNFCVAWRAAISSLFSRDGPDSLRPGAGPLPGTGSMPTSATGPGRPGTAPPAHSPRLIVPWLCSQSGPSLQKHRDGGWDPEGDGAGWTSMRPFRFHTRFIPNTASSSAHAGPTSPALTGYHFTITLRCGKQVQLVHQLRVAGGEIPSGPGGWLLIY